MSASPAPTGPSSAPGREKSSLLWWVLGLLATGMVILGLGGLLVVRHVARNIEVIQAGDRVEVRTPAGDFKAARSGGDTTGLPQYPGATLSEPAGSIEIESPNGESASINAAKYRTTDTVDKVDAWYRERLGPEFEREGSGKMENKKKIFGITVTSDDIAYISEKDERLAIVAIQRRSGHTEIALVRIGQEEVR